MSGAPRVVRRPSSTYVTPSRLAARRAASLNSSSACVCHLDVAALRRFTPAASLPPTSSLPRPSLRHPGYAAPLDGLVAGIQVTASGDAGPGYVAGLPLHRRLPPPLVLVVRSYLVQPRVRKRMSDGRRPGGRLSSSRPIGRRWSSRSSRSSRSSWRRDDDEDDARETRLNHIATQFETMRWRRESCLVDAPGELWCSRKSTEKT